MADQWFYTDNRERRGPFPEEQLKHLASSGQLKPTDLVWKKGMAAWVRAAEIEGLIPTTAAAVPPPAIPPPLPQAALMPSALLTPKRIAICAVGIAAVVVGLLAIKAMFFGAGGSKQSPAVTESAEKSPSQQPRTEPSGASSAPGPRATLIFSSPLVGRWS